MSDKPKTTTTNKYEEFLILFLIIYPLLLLPVFLWVSGSTRQCKEIMTIIISLHIVIGLGISIVNYRLRLAKILILIDILAILVLTLTA